MQPKTGQCKNQLAKPGKQVLEGGVMHSKTENYYKTHDNFSQSASTS